MRFSTAFLFASLFASASASTSSADEEGNSLRRRTYVLPEESSEDNEPTRRVFLKYHPNRRSAFKAELTKRSSKIKMHYDFEDMDTFVVTVPESDYKALYDDPDVVAIHDDTVRYAMHIPESVKPRQLQNNGEEVPYGIDMVQAQDVWALGGRGANVTVCVVDTGVDETHEDLVGVTGSSSDPLPFGNDGVGHGTHCAGTIAAAQNGKGVVGVAPDAKVFSVKVFADNGGFAYSSGILGAAKTCAENGANIISMSLGGPLPNPFEIFGFRKLLKDNDIISVAAAGNSGNGLWSFPASYPGVVSVAALDENMEIAKFSQYNRQVDIAAPGVDVLSTFPMKAPCMICDSVQEYGYGTISGTSMATPHVAGVLALLKSLKPEATFQELVEVMQESARDLGKNGKDKNFGHGLVQAFDAANLLTGGALSKSPDSQASKSTKCGEDELFFDLKLLTDDAARETYWELGRITDGGVELAGAGYDDDSAVAVEKCIPKNCYTFTMYDSHGDGLCCAKGSGAYSLSVDGESLITNGGEFESEDMTTFGECVEDTPTETKASN